MTRILRTLFGIYSMTVLVIVLLGIFCPLLIVAPTLPLRRAIGRLGVRAWLALSFIPFRVRGLEHLPPGPCIAVCNHASYLDGIIVTAALPGRFTFLVQHGAADWPYVGLIIKRMNVSFVNRGSVRAAALATREMIERIQAGESFAIFPEGTFRRPATLLPFQLRRLHDRRARRRAGGAGGAARQPPVSTAKASRRYFTGRRSRWRSLPR